MSQGARHAAVYSSNGHLVKNCTALLQATEKYRFVACVISEQWITSWLFRGGGGGGGGGGELWGFGHCTWDIDTEEGCGY